MLNLTIKARLFLIMGVLAFLTFAVQGGASLALRDMTAGMQAIYNDRIVPLRDLKQIADAYAVFIVDATHKMRSGTFTSTQGHESVVAASKLIAERWSAYKNTTLTSEEAALVAIAQERMDKADAAIAKLQGIMSSNDRAALASFAETEMYPVIDPISETISQLVDLQLRVASEVHAEKEAIAHCFRALSRPEVADQRLLDFQEGRFAAGYDGRA